MRVTVYLVGSGSTMKFDELHDGVITKDNRDSQPGDAQSAFPHMSKTPRTLRMQKRTIVDGLTIRNMAEWYSSESFHLGTLPDGGIAIAAGAVEIHVMPDTLATTMPEVHEGNAYRC